MWKSTSMFRQAVILATVGTAGLQSPVFAEGETERCVRSAIADCAEAMEDANWLERIALGVLCSSLISACLIDGAAQNLVAKME